MLSARAAGALQAACGEPCWVSEVEVGACVDLGSRARPDSSCEVCFALRASQSVNSPRQGLEVEERQGREFLNTALNGQLGSH